MKLTIDRIEGAMAVVIADDGRKFDVPADILPEAREGNIYTITPETGETEKRKSEMKKLIDEIWE